MLVELLSILCMILAVACVVLACKLSIARFGERVSGDAVDRLIASRDEVELELKKARNDLANYGARMGRAEAALAKIHGAAKPWAAE